MPIEGCLVLPFFKAHCRVIYGPWDRTWFKSLKRCYWFGVPGDLGQVWYSASIDGSPALVQGWSSLGSVVNSYLGKDSTRFISYKNFASVRRCSARACHSSDHSMIVMPLQVIKTRSDQNTSWTPSDGSNIVTFQNSYPRYMFLRRCPMLGYTPQDRSDSSKNQNWDSSTKRLLVELY